MRYYNEIKWHVVSNVQMKRLNTIEDHDEYGYNSEVDYDDRQR